MHESFSSEGSWFGFLLTSLGNPEGEIRMEVDDYEVYLVDDGTMDTVVEVCHGRWPRCRTFRYSDASEYRDESGCLNFDAFAKDVVIPDAEMEE